MTHAHALLLLFLPSLELAGFLVDPAFFSRFSLVIGSQLHESTLTKMAGLCWENAIPFLHVRSYGLMGHVRLVSGCANAYGVDEDRWARAGREGGLSPTRAVNVVFTDDYQHMSTIDVAWNPRCSWRYR